MKMRVKILKYSRDGIKIGREDSEKRFPSSLFPCSLYICKKKKISNLIKLITLRNEQSHLIAFYLQLTPTKDKYLKKKISNE